MIRFLQFFDLSSFFFRHPNFASKDLGIRPTGVPRTTNAVELRHWWWARPNISMPGWRLWLQFAVLTALCMVIYYPVIISLVGQWLQDPNYSYGFFVPLFSALWCWMHRDAWMRPACPANSGLPVIVMALALLVVGIVGAEVFLQRASLIILLAGLIVYFVGWRTLRSLLAPLLFLLLMIPLPAIIFNEIAFPLQLLASRLSTFFLDAVQVPAIREGNVILLPSITLDVAEACSGIRSLMSLTTLAIIYGSLAERRSWMRWTLAILAVPIAVMANALRIVGAAICGYYWGPRFAEGFFHSFSGWLMFVLALSSLILLHRLGSRLSIWKAAT